DVRVRERNLKSGALTDKDLEKYLGGLPDVADQSEPFAIAQPALTDQPQHVQAAAPERAMAAPDMGDDEDDDDDDLGDEGDADEVDAQGDDVAQPNDDAGMGDAGGLNGEGEAT